MGLGREGPGVGAGDGEAEDGEGGVAEGGGHVGHGSYSTLPGFLFFLLVRRSLLAREEEGRLGGEGAPLFIAAQARSPGAVRGW